MTISTGSGPLFTRDAYRFYFRSPTFVVVEEPLLASVQSLLPDGVGILVLRDSGTVLTLPQIDFLKEPEADLSVEFSPVGCMGFWVTATGEAYVKPLKAIFEKAEADITPPIIVLDPGDDNQLAKGLVSAIPTLLKRLQHATVRLGNRDQQIAHLRRKTEGLVGGLSQLEQKLDGMGLDRSYLVLTVQPGEKTLGPSGDYDSYGVIQTLPVDIANLSRIDLHVAKASSSDGVLDINLVRKADALIVSGLRKPYSEIEEGWVSLDIGRMTAIETGEAFLAITWGDFERDAGPVFSLAAAATGRAIETADVSSDQVDDPIHHPLAMRVFRQFRPEALLSAADYRYRDIANDRVVPLSALEHQYAFDEISEQSDVTELGGHPVSRDDDAGFIQTHPIPDRWVGFRLPLVLSLRDSRVSFGVETEHKMGPETLYRLVIVREGAALSKDGIPENPDDLLGMSEVDLPPQLAAVLSVDLDKPIEQRADVIGLVALKGSNKSFGWCRWRDFRIGRGSSSSFLPAISDHTAVIEQGERHYLRSFRFPDIARDIEFIGGQDALDKETEEAGFSPIMIMADGSYMQVHPLLHRLSAAILSAGVPAAATQISADVRTAHDGTQSMMYVLGALSVDAESRGKLEDVLTTILNEAARAGLPEESVIDVLEDGIAGKLLLRPVKALEKARLWLDVEGMAEAEAIFAVVPLEESINFGWCRWYSYHVEMQSEG